MKQTAWQYLQDTILYLFKPGILLYWGGYGIVSARHNISILQTIMRNHPDASAQQWAQMLQLYSTTSFAEITLFILLIYKAVDCVVRIAHGKSQTVPFAPYSIAPPLMVLKYFGVILLPLWSVWGVLPTLPALLMTGVLFFLSPALIMTMVKYNRLKDMLHPANWQEMISCVGRQRYLAILFMPLLTALLTGLGGGIFCALLFAAMAWQEGQILLCTQGFLAFLQACFIALPMIYCAYFLRDYVITPPVLLDEDEKRAIHGAPLRQMPAKAQKDLAAQLLAADKLHARGEDEQAIALLRPYVYSCHKNDVCLPACQRLQNIYQHNGDSKALQDLEYLMIQLTAQGNEAFYPLIKHPLTELAAQDLAQLPADWISPLVKTAGNNRDYSLVLSLSRALTPPFDEHQDAVEIGYYRAQALDKTGDRAQSVQLLQQLLTHCPQHRHIARVKRAYDLLQQQP